MDNNEQPTKDNEVKVPKKKHRLRWMVALLLLLLLAGGGYLWWQLQTVSDQKAELQKDKQALQAKLDKLQGKDQADATPAQKEEVVCNETNTPTATMKENIKAALDSKNTAAFATYFSDPVKFVLAASEKSGNETPDEAAVSMEYANTATGPWDFSLPAPTLAAYDAGFYTSYFDSNTYVGRAASGQVAAFDFNCDGKINQAFLAAHEDLL